ncbi:MAG: glutamine--tRNA ligase/YqeY domain fusion protein [Alistipes sp.]|jgi:glutamyl/glutaminyl-tRNA synthetase|nr:glutamine--tRNA ligase/YqeY domain fusion protein [Alistipes sp.]
MEEKYIEGVADAANNTPERSLNFIEEIVEKYIADGGTELTTRFPPEPNGYLHIGHAKSICLNFGLAARYGGKCNLRFDDTNPVKEDVEYVDSIKEDIKWLGFDWAEERYASDYFEQLYDWAVMLIRKGLAYVDDQTQEQIRTTRGTITEPGANSPFRDRSVEDNLRLFAAMRAGEFADGSCVLRAKIDMGHSNMLFRDPILYRIIHTSHHRTDDKWCIYPMYDFAHGESDSIERITHSICTLEFAVHRPLYDWFIEKLEIFPSHQYEFARLNLTHTIMSKRKLLQLVQEGVVNGWDDPRMPTISGMRRRGYTPTAIRAFAERVGVAKRDNVIDLGLLEFSVREDLNKTAERRMVVMDPLKVIITNFGVSASSDTGCSGAECSTGNKAGLGDKGVASGCSTGNKASAECERFHRLSADRQSVEALAEASCEGDNKKEDVKHSVDGCVEMITCVNNPEDESAGTREVPLTREIYIERGDFMEDPPKKYYRLSPGGEVRLRYGYLIRCDEVVRDPATGEIVELRCSYDPESAGGGSSDGRRVKGVIHWVSVPHAVKAEARLYSTLFSKENPDDCSEGETFLSHLNPESLVTTTVYMEPSLASAAVGEKFQFERIGYFCKDADSVDGAPVFNRTVTLKDSFAKTL